MGCRQCAAPWTTEQQLHCVFETPTSRGDFPHAPDDREHNAGMYRPCSRHGRLRRPGPDRPRQHAGKAAKDRQGGHRRARKLGPHGLCHRRQPPLHRLPRGVVREGAGPDRAQRQDRIHGHHRAEHHAAGAERHGGSGLRPHDQQPQPPKAGLVCRHHLCQPGAHGRACGLARDLVQAAGRQDRGCFGRHHRRAAAAQIQP